MINYSLQADEVRDASGRCNRLFREGSRLAWSPRAKWDLAETSRGSWEDPGLLSDTELHSHRRRNPVNVTVIYWIFHFPFSLCCLVFVGLLVSVHPVLFCSRCRCAVSERNHIAFALTSSGLVSHLISLFKGGLEKHMREKQQEMWFKNPDVFIAPCEKWNTIC